MIEHPDDDALSAHLDGEGEAAVAAHVESCAPCQARLAELRAAADAVAEPVPVVDAEARRAAIATAVDSGGVAGRRRPVPTWVAAAAAAVVLALAAVPVIASLRDNDRGRTDATATSGDLAAGEAALMAAPDDLGPQSDPATLRLLLEEQLRTPRGAVQPPVAAQAREGTEEADAAASGGAAGRAAGPADAGAPCEGEARAAGAGRVGVLLYVAVLQWETRPAVVYVFEAPDPDAERLTRRAFVMARQDCQLLVAQSF